MSAVFICAACTYPFPEGFCRNPGCEANPDVTQSQKDRWRAEREKRDAEESERKRINRIRRRFCSFSC